MMYSQQKELSRSTRFPRTSFLALAITYFTVQVGCERCFSDIEKGSCHPHDTIATHVTYKQCCDIYKGTAYSSTNVVNENGEFPCIKCEISVDGAWGEWSPYSSCSTSCDEGTQVRYRQCNNPPPSGNGKPCYKATIANREIISCKLTNCPRTSSPTTKRTTVTKEIPTLSTKPTQTMSTTTRLLSSTFREVTQSFPSTWGNWELEEPCNATCGNGTIKWKRFCLLQNKIIDSSECPGNSTRFEECQSSICETQTEKITNTGARIVSSDGLKTNFIMYIAIAIVVAAFIVLVAGFGFWYYKRGYPCCYQPKANLYIFDKDTTVLTYKKVVSGKDTKNNTCCADNSNDPATFSIMNTSDCDGYEIPRNILADDHIYEEC